MIQFEIEQVRKKRRTFRIEAFDQGTSVGDLTFLRPEFPIYALPVQLLDWSIRPGLRVEESVDELLFRQFADQLGQMEDVFYREKGLGLVRGLFDQNEDAILRSGLIENYKSRELLKRLPTGRLLDAVGIELTNLQIRMDNQFQIKGVTLRGVTGIRIPGFSGLHHPSNR